jgi:hypothetical protein
MLDSSARRISLSSAAAVLRELREVDTGVAGAGEDGESSEACCVLAACGLVRLVTIPATRFGFDSLLFRLCTALPMPIPSVGRFSVELFETGLLVPELRSCWAEGASCLAFMKEE